MKTAMKKLFSLVLVAVLLVGMMPFQAFADEIINVPVDIYVNGSYIRTADLPVSEDITLDEDLALSMLEVTNNRSLDKWVSSTGKEFQSAALGYAWLAEQDAYSLKMYLIDTTPAPEPEPEPECSHSWNEASCTTPKTCATCGETEGEALGHTPGDAATCTTAQTCTVCNEELTAALGHTFENGECSVCGLCEACETDPCTCSKTMYTVSINVTKDGISRSISRTYEEGTEITLNAALVDEVAFGSATVEWIVNGDHENNGATITVDSSMTISCSITNKKTETVTITLNANGGRLQSYESKKYTVVIGQPYGNLPEPTRSGHTFAYWYYKDDNGNEVRVYNTSIVENKKTLYAKWVANGYTVTFQRYDMINGWVDVEDHTVPNGSKLTVEDGTFPSDSRISLVYDVSGFEIVGWKVVETGATFKKNSTKVNADMTLRPRYQGSVKLTAQEPDTGASWKSSKVTLEIGEPIGKLTNPGARSTYAFDGWLASNGSTLICDRFCKSTVKYYPHLHGTTFYAKWAGGVTVNLHIHTNGNTSSASKIIPYYVAPAEGVFDLKAVDLYSLYASYYKYDDDCDKKIGWYDSEEWKNYCANRASHPATSYTDIVRNGQYDFHIMLIDKGDDSSSSSSNSSSNKADSSNPKTGDMIMAPAMILVASVGAMAVLFYLNKKRTV